MHCYFRFSDKGSSEMCVKFLLLLIVKIVKNASHLIAKLIQQTCAS
jgi:hypothetical protein